ncbi:hypothetical protein L1987_08755 [Smallanthus sonchifolius]|uniref:Uncharacterized protein n=1 Tax=Smallanthus sonchifolius TaxID=185202 RepID=A0ACB9JM16_9ASTR|nr:hypothetical protein L1987_08755 [Smallanthus sonchifolius]
MWKFPKSFNNLLRRPFKRSEEAITPDPTKYKILYDSIDAEALDDRYMKSKLTASREENGKARKLREEEVKKRDEELDSEKIKELDAAKILAFPNVKLEEISKGLYSSATTEDQRKCLTKKRLHGSNLIQKLQRE